MKLLITGGCGFIGSAVVRLAVAEGHEVVNLDALTYAACEENVASVAAHPAYTFEHADIRDRAALDRIFAAHGPDAVMHLAAESHVDRSIDGPGAFVDTNVTGTFTLLQAARAWWEGQGRPASFRFHHISTDEVFGSLGPEDPPFTEASPYDPRSPYSASKAGSDHLVRAWGHTFGLPVVLSNCSNNYGPYQFPEKLLPLFINNIKHLKPLPVYGKGINVRDWLYVEDHARAIDDILHRGRVGETYNIGGHNEYRNIDLIRLLCQLMDKKLDRPAGTSEQLITYVTDRAGHDMRYAIDATKLRDELGWMPSLKFEEGLARTIDWYLENDAWLESVTSGAYQAYYDRMYN